MEIIFYGALFILIAFALVFCMPQAKHSTQKRNKALLDEALKPDFEVVSVEWDYNSPKFTVIYKPDNYDHKIQVVIKPARHVRDAWVIDGNANISVPGDIVLHLTTLLIGYRKEQDKKNIQDFYAANRVKENNNGG